MNLYIAKELNDVQENVSRLKGNSATLGFIPILGVNACFDAEHEETP
jgi:hypothetical protein